MRQILYALHFRGQASPAVNRDRVLHTAGSATGCSLRTLIRNSKLESEVEPEDGDLAFFESELRATGVDEFEEEGAISFGDDSEHLLRFSTVGHGHFTKDAVAGMMTGSANWKVEGGEGQFASASGFISAAFTLSDTGERCDYHCGLIFLPD
jgi:hypothetical protein